MIVCSVGEYLHVLPTEDPPLFDRRIDVCDATPHVAQFPTLDTLPSSAHAVDGQWWHAFRSLVSLSLLGFLAGPLVAFGLLLFSPAAVSTVNIVSSLVYAAITPFVAVCLSLLYFDLSATLGD